MPTLLLDARFSRVALVALAAALALFATDPEISGASAAAEPRRLVIAPQPASGPLRAMVGKSLKLTARLELANGKAVALDEHVAWNSSDPTILRVGDGRNGDPPGLVTPLRPGVAGVSVIYPPIGRSAKHPLPYQVQTPLGDAVTIVVAER
ncbi:MAG TPA: hypothetical protein VIS07_00290 [Candidatus Binatia bacterium]